MSIIGSIRAALGAAPRRIARELLPGETPGAG
jgi:hypothetical protein